VLDAPVALGAELVGEPEPRAVHRRADPLELGRGALAGVRVIGDGLQAVRGEPQIDRVVVQYSDGDTQTVQIDSRLMDGAGEVIRLDPGRRINRVTVYTERNARGLYSVYLG